MKILVTGGCGFIGSNFVLHMLGQGNSFQIRNLDALTYAGNPANLKSVESSNSYSFVHGSITDRSLVKSAIEGVEAIVNFAAESHVDRSIKTPGIFVETNVLGTQVLLDAAKEAGIAKYVQVSTDEVYGSLPETGAFTEETPLAPNSPYSASKAGGDLLVRAYHETFGLPASIMRCSNNYGPYQYPEKLIPLMILRALNNEKLPVYGDGLYVRDWLHVKDHCRAIEAVLLKGKPGRVYNVGGNNTRTNLEIVHMILSRLKRGPDLIEHVQDRLGHDRRYAVDASRITAELGWRPEYTVERGIEETIQWYLDNSGWLEQISRREKG